MRFLSENVPVPKASWWSGAAEAPVDKPASIFRGSVADSRSQINIQLSAARFC